MCGNVQLVFNHQRRTPQIWTHCHVYIYHILAVGTRIDLTFKYEVSTQLTVHCSIR